MNGFSSNHDRLQLQRDEPALICARCSETLGDTWFENSMGGKWHPLCFLCTACGQAIAERQFPVRGQDPYHSICYKKKFDPICEVCHDFVPVNEVTGRIEWRFHPFWKTKYCPIHETDGTVRCDSCERMQPGDQQPTIVDDMRKLCSQCSNSMVMDSNVSQTLYQNVLKFYKQLGLTIKREPPVLLVDRTALKAAAEKDGRHRFDPGARGMCLSDEPIVDDKTHNRPSTPKRGRDYSHGQPSRQPRHEPQPSIHMHLVSRILVLFGFPRMLTGSIMAHEVMHTWLKLNGVVPFSGLTNEVEEGLCQVMAYLWLQNEAHRLTTADSVKSLPGSQFEGRLGLCLMDQIEKHDSPVYGKGFLAARESIAKYGLTKTLHRVKITGTCLWKLELENTITGINDRKLKPFDLEFEVPGASTP